MPCPHGQLDPFPGLGRVPGDPEHGGFGDLSVPSPPAGLSQPRWPSRLGGTRGPPRVAVGGRAGGWVGRVCIGAAWFRRGGVGSGAGAGAGSPGAAVPPGRPLRLGHRGGRAGSVPRPSPRGSAWGGGWLWDPHAWGERGYFQRPSVWVWGALVSPVVGEGSGRAQAGVSQMEAASGAR